MVGEVPRAELLAELLGAMRFGRQAEAEFAWRSLALRPKGSKSL